MKARLNQRMEDLNESLKRRDKRIKQINDDNYKLVECTVLCYTCILICHISF